jgi:hypothetical protein
MRETPSAFGLSHFAVAGAGAAARADDAAGAGACAFWAQTVVAADIDIASAIAKALRIAFSIVAGVHFGKFSSIHRGFNRSSQRHNLSSQRHAQLPPKRRHLLMIGSLM